MLRSSKLDPSDLRGQIRKIETDLLDQGIRSYPTTRTGERARFLWVQIKPRLLQGAVVEITTSALRLDWHREELKRARNILIEMGLIRRRADGRYALERYDQLDELVRDQFLDLKLLEAVAISVSGLVPKSKTRKK